MNLLALASALAFVQGGLVPDQFLVKPPASTKVLAKVNGVEIKASEVEAMLWDWRGQEVLQDLISYRLIRSEADRVRVDVPEVEVLKAVDDELNKVKAGLPQGKELDVALREQGFPRSRLYLRVRTNLMLTRIAEKLFDAKQFVKVSTMLFKPKSAAASDVSDAVKRAEAAYDRLKKGEKWDVVLKATQDNQGLVGSNGLLGWRTLDAFPEPTRGEFKAAKAGDLTKPVQTAGGIQFFRVEAVGSGLKGPELDELRGMYMGNARVEILDRLRKDGKVERF